MNKFNGFSKIELEMLKEETAKFIPALITLLPTFAELTKRNFEEFKKKGFNENQATSMAVQATAIQLGIGGQK